VMERLGMTHIASVDHLQVAVGSPLRPRVLYRLDLPGWSRAAS